MPCRGLDLSEQKVSASRRCCQFVCRGLGQINVAAQQRGRTGWIRPFGRVVTPACAILATRATRAENRNNRVLCSVGSPRRNVPPDRRVG